MAKKSTPVSPSSGFVTRPTSKPTRPVRPSQPVTTGTISTANEGKVTTKKVKG
jgi:hypothetical protein